MDFLRAADGRVLHEADGGGGLRDVLDQARRGTLPGLVRTRVKFAEAADEWLRYVEHDRNCKPSTLSDYGSVARQLVAEFGEMRVDRSRRCE